MTSTQKKFFEWPLMLLIIWVLQAFEIALSRVFLFNLTAFQFLPVLILYLALSRDWGQLAILGTIFAYLSASVSSTQPMISISVYLWIAFSAKILVIAFALENRWSFTYLAGGALFSSKILYGFLLNWQEFPVDWWIVLKNALLFGILSALVAFLFFPLFVFWDKFFEHNIDNSRDLNPVI